MSSPQIYKIRYFVGPWNKPRPGDTSRDLVPIPGVRIRPGDNCGYTDTIFVASILGYPDEPDVLLLSSEPSDSGGQGPPRKLLELIRDQINHHLEHHCPNEQEAKEESGT